ncbi:MAG: arginine deiminase, partial [Coriobacteriaceae bacterium]|nr:arginine deiminase [Coriobacteriaceae bacterium]
TNKNSSLVDLVSDSAKLVVAPMPNLYFTRDPFATIGNGVSVNRMTYETRNRETIFGEYIFKYHPDLLGTPNYYNRYSTFHIEGGDILNLSETVLAIGISERTEPDAIDTIAKTIFSSEESTIETILAFNIPNTRAFMHLDTVFTMIDHDKFTVHPGILGPLAVFEITPDGTEDIKVKEIHATLEDILERYLGHPVELINCGGHDRIAAEREQWNDGSNTLAIAPGSIVVYERNEVTNAILKERGLNVIEIPSAELSRGRGGPRCMSMPLWRED